MSSQPVSIRDVAERAGVALGTVSNVLNRPEKVAESTRAKVLAAIDELGFVRNDAARQLRAGRSRTIGLIVLNVGNPFFTDISRGAEDRALESNLTVLLGNSDSSADREHAYLDLFEEQRVMGLLISPVDDMGARLERLRSRGTPTVLVDRMATEENQSSVSVDDVSGGQIAVRHLIEQGCRRIAFVGGPLGFRQVEDRLAGARRAVGEAPGVELEVFAPDGMTAQTGREAGAELAARPAADRPDGVFVANDLMAVGLLQTLLQPSDISVPEDIAVIGYDDIDFAGAAAVPMSSVRQPAELIGRTAVELLLEQAAATGDQPYRHRQVVFQPELVVRESTRRTPA